jgi:2-keto-3-deoxy-L-rhamnonate aldolase RhmA
MRGQRIKAKLGAGQPVFTTGLRFHSPRLVELLARSGADQIFLDAEHGPLSEGEPWRDDVQAVVERVLQTCRRHGMPFGTVPRDRADLRRQIERGCQLITVSTLDWGIQATRDTVAELSAVKVH